MTHSGDVYGPFRGVNGPLTWVNGPLRGIGRDIDSDVVGDIYRERERGRE